MTQNLLRSRRFYPPLFAYLLDTFGLAILYPIGAHLVLNGAPSVLGIALAEVDKTIILSLLIFTFPMAQFIGAPLMGTLSDQVGRKKVFLATISGGAIGYLITGLGVYFHHLLLLLAGRLLCGFFAGNLTLCLASIADHARNKKSRAKDFGAIGTIGGLGFVLAILAGASSWVNPSIPFFIASILCAINFALMMRLYTDPKQSHSHSRSILTSIAKAQAGLLYSAYFFFMLGWLTTLQFLSAYLIEIYNAPKNSITLLFFFLATTWSLSNFVIHPFLAKKISSQKIFLIGLTCLPIFLILALIPKEPFPLFFIHFILGTLFAALSWTSGLATLSNQSAKQSQGAILGVNQALVALASITGPLLGGILITVDIHRLYFFTAGSVFLAMILLLIRSEKVIPH